MTYLKSLADTENNIDTAINGSFSLTSDELIGFFEDYSTFAVAGQGPGDAKVFFELRNTQLTGEGTIGFVEHVLGSNGDLGASDLLCCRKIDGGRSNHDLGFLVNLGIVQSLNDLSHDLSRTVPVKYGMSSRST